MKLTACLANPTVHLDEKRLRPPDSCCPVCGGTERSTILPIQSDPDVWLLRCRDCDVASVSRMPTSRALEEYYGGYYDEQCSPVMAEEAVTMVGPERLARHVYRRSAAALRGPRPRLLDYGGGDGTIGLLIAGLALDSGAAESVRVDVVDMHEGLASNDDARIRLQHHPDLDALPLDAHDLVLASGILEHVPRPGTTMRDLLARMRPGGMFYARTPYEVPLMRWGRRFGARPELGFPGHLHDMGQRFWERVPRTLGLEGEYAIVCSKPSIVATTLDSHFFRTLVAYVLKAPAYLLGTRYGLVGGWEVFVQRGDAATSTNLAAVVPVVGDQGG